MAPTDQDIEDLREIVEALIDLIFEGQNEMRALERVLVERHGLSLEVLSEFRDQETKKVNALREAAGTAIQKLKRFQGPPQ